MKNEIETRPGFERDIAFPNILVKTRYGNVHLKSLIQNKRIIIFTNPSELLPKNSNEKVKFETALRQLKDLNFHMIGFSKNSFEEHLRSINWLNSYLEEELVFHVFYQPKNEVTKYLDKSLSKKIPIENPIYFIDQSGNTKSILNGDYNKNKSLENIVERAYEMIISDQKFGNFKVLGNN